MRAVIQRVLDASVEVGEQKISQIGRGLCVLLGITHEDDQSDADYIVKKLLQIRLFEDDKGKPWALSATQLDLDLLIVSQFTLYARLKGNKPDYHLSAGSQPAQALFDKIIQQLRKEYKADKVHTGAFGEHMQVRLCNDGPVTIILDSNSREPVLKPKTGSEAGSDSVSKKDAPASEAAAQ